MQLEAISDSSLLCEMIQPSQAALFSFSAS
jgi:hypothetical protein